MQRITIEITECDLDNFKDVVYNGSSFSWTFPTDETKEEIEIEFVPECEEEE